MRVRPSGGLDPAQSLISAKNLDLALGSQANVVCVLFLELFLERGEVREKERERNINMWFPLAHPLLGTWPTTQAHALTGNQTSDPLLPSLVLNPLSHSSQGQAQCYVDSCMALLLS